VLSGDSLYLIAGAALLLGAVLPRLLRRAAMSVPMAFVGAGVLVGLLPLPGGQPISPITQPEVAERLAELVVIVAIFGVGIALDRPVSLRGWASTWRLLGLAMPLFIAVAALLGWWVMGLVPAAALLLGAVLAPTDPVLASDVQVSGPGTGRGRRSQAGGTAAAGHDEPAGPEDIDEHDEARFALTSEAGLNDALAFPFVYAAIFLAASGDQGGVLRWLGWELVGKTVWGAVIGAALGWFLANMAFRSRNRWLRLADSGEPLLALAAIFTVYGAAEVAGGYGFLAVFAAAVAGRAVERRHEYHGQLHEFTSQIEHLLTMTLLLLFGAALSWGLLANLTWQGALVAVLLVVVVRPLTAGLSLARTLPLGATGLGSHEIRVVAFFGVKGIGSFYYLAYATGEIGFPGSREVWSAAAFAVLVSVVVHGALATPVMTRLDRVRGTEEPAP
jgi:sodium/hydrogen antiporter